MFIGRACEGDLAVIAKITGMTKVAIQTIIGFCSMQIELTIFQIKGRRNAQSYIEY